MYSKKLFIASLIFTLMWAGFRDNGLMDKMPAPPVNWAEVQTGSTDRFGYHFDDTLPMNWIDATSGTVITFDNTDDGYSDPVNIGFSFKFYENIYTQFFIGTNGILSFGAGIAEYSNVSIPLETPPNNFIAPMWDDLDVSSGTVYAKRFTSAGGNYFVIEWVHVNQLGASDPLTFEIVLYENGNILFQYQQLSPTLQGETVGIEDPDGVDGLLYWQDAPGLNPGLAIWFYRPALMARVKLLPAYQGGFTASRLASFRLTLRNIGELGSDLYSLAAVPDNPSWTVSLCNASGAPLIDSNHDGKIDTGSLSQGAVFTWLVKITAPPSAQTGDYTRVDLTATSTLDPAKAATASLQSAIPAPFAQAYANKNGGIRLLRTWQNSSIDNMVALFFTGNTLSIKATLEGNYMYAWEENAQKQVGGQEVYFTEVKYAILSRLSGLGNIQTLSHSESLATPTRRVSARYPTVAVTPDGKIGVAWSMVQNDLSTNTTNSNIYFAILDGAGNVTLSEVNLSNDPAWYAPNDPNGHYYDFPGVAATPDNRFFITWVDKFKQNDQEISGLYTMIYASTGGQPVQGKTLFTTSVAGSTLFIDPFVIGLSGNRVFLVYSLYDLDASTYAVTVAAFNSQGNSLFGPSTIPNSNGWKASAVQFNNGNILVAWGDPGAYKLAYALLDDTSYGVVSGFPKDLPQIGGRRPDFISMTVVSTGQAVLTWMDADWKGYLCYSLINSGGTILTPPMIFLSGPTGNSLIQSSQAGLGNTVYNGIWETFLPIIRR